MPGHAARGTKPHGRSLPTRPTCGQRAAREHGRLGYGLRSATGAEALKLLRGRYPDSPLSLRVAALDFLMRSGGGAGRRSA